MRPWQATETCRKQLAPQEPGEMKMYQIREIDGQRLINSYEIVVIGTGENGLCEVHDGRNNKKTAGTYAECVQWLRDRNMLVNG